ncbi:Lipid A export ATP-binding/permease protein MsbA [Liberibacter crescens BT-1]|uniref:Lipid A export ATP-binding/permease protein MsbA n=1 Tax=Liberibacter crescens (strain BT-1) TaxID=1215343 RepID=L0EVX4_LIBCB|nr:ABC transporter ATP-binding protein [Liberibacter crescens]AGA64995.1 Lipid A export ATP-binding/permease protein MsbA [Liberibacter crescens BT-1]AMC13009.1 ABC transporter ATP-binding protein [Liberibacter crescens]
MLRNILSSVDKKIWFRLFKENFRKHMKWYSISIASMIIVSTTTALSAWIMRDVVNEMIVSRNIVKIFTISSMVACIFLVKGVASFLQSYYLSRAGNSIIAEQQRKIYDRLLQHDMTFYNSNRSSELQMRFTHVTQTVRNVIDTVITSFVRDLFSLIGLIVVMFIQQPILSISSLIIGPLCILGIRLLLKRVRDITQIGLVALGQIIQNLQDTIIGIRVIKAFSLENIMRERMQNAIQSVEERANSIALIEAATSPIMETISGFVIAGVIVLSGILVIEKGNTPGELMSFITALLLAYEPAKRIARTRITLETGMIGVRFMFELLDFPIHLKESPEAIKLPNGAGKIVFHGVNFSYTKDYPILSNINLCFDSGKMTALVGPSGGGKSTIINLLMRLYDPDSGFIEIDGVDIRNVTFDSLRSHISYVGQDMFLFSGTVRHNIMLGCPTASEEEVVEAAKSANAHDFIMDLPQGYNTDIGENGANISGGQKQRICIARAMLRDSRILILDEATSALDSNSEALVRQAIARLTKGKTTIVIAHRMSTVTQADHIVVIEDGKVVEEGVQEFLLERGSGLYRKLYNAQLLLK